MKAKTNLNSRMETTALIILGILSLVANGCGRKEQLQRQKHDAAKHEWQNAIASFAKKHDAQVDWESNIPERGSHKSPFSIDVSKALMPTNGQAVLLMMELKDIAENRDGFFATFDGYYSKSQNFEVCLTAKCAPKIANQILQISKGRMLDFADFAVVVKVERVSRARFEVQGTVEGTPEGDLPNLEVNFSPDIYIVRGTCIDVIHRDDAVVK